MPRFVKSVFVRIAAARLSASGSLEPSALHEAVAKLSERDRDIISLRFGLLGRREYTQKEVADRMGISQSYISRLEKRILLRLRREMQKIMA